MTAKHRQGQLFPALKMLNVSRWSEDSMTQLNPEWGVGSQSFKETGGGT